MNTASELDAERAVVARLYGRLDELRARTTGHLAGVLGAPGTGTPQGRSERDALAQVFSERLAGFAVGDLPLCFGRLDLTGGARFHIGRLALADDDHEPLLVDWRAPAASPFYQATAGDPQGVVRRRHLLTRGREVTGVDDEVFDLEALPEAEREGLQGDAALLAALTRSRTGRMGDIVATIQAEQDRVIRSDLDGVLVVDGGPGTGKTAVALHRSAYLLYTHRRALAGTGVLVVGPNATFLRYIEQVLPSLGETGVLLLTPGQLFPGVTANRHDPLDVARVKGDPRMVTVLRRAIEDRQRVPRADIVVLYDGRRLVLRRRTCAAIRAAARRNRRPHNRARETVERLALDALVAQVHPGSGVSPRGPGSGVSPRGPGSGVSPDVSAITGEDSAEMAALTRRELAGGRAFREAMERLWPRLRPEELINDLFGFPALLRSAATGVLAEEEIRLLERPRHAGLHPRELLAALDWSVEDVPLLDEAADLLGEAEVRRRVRDSDDVAFARRVLDGLDLHGPLDPTRMAQRWAAPEVTEAVADRARKERTWEFGHIVVDEAQELSAMVWRVLFRRGPARSMTVVGDLAQAGVPWAPHRWADVFDLHARGRWRTARLSVNYRTPREIMAAATAVLAVVDPMAEAPIAMRDGGEEPWVREGRPVAETAAAAALDEMERIGDGRLALLTPTALRDEVAAAVAARIPGAVTGAGTAVLDAPVAVLAVREAKGLEFDSVIVVEPARIWSESSSGGRDLYDALTRSTRRLGLVHADPLPPELTVSPLSHPPGP